MKLLGILILSIILLIPSFFFSQDVITKIDGSELEVKVLEVEDENIKYRKYSNLEGPLYNIKTNEVFKVKYENGDEDLFTVTELSKLDSSISETNFERKGIHIGVDVIAGSGNWIAYDPGFYFNASLSFDMYFNNFIGVRTGFRYERLSINHYDDVPSRMELRMQSFGMPVKFLLTTKGKIGFYIETGFAIYFFWYSRQDFYYPGSISYPNALSKYRFSGYDTTLDFETSSGISIELSEKINLKTGLAFGIAIIDMGSIDMQYNREKYFGVQIGATYKLSK